MKKILKKLLITVLIIIVIPVLAFALFILYLTVREYKPEDVEILTVTGTEDEKAALVAGNELTIVTWNVGCGSLGDNADFFMDNGSMVYTADKERVQTNLEGLKNSLQGLNPDILMLQEVDEDASRSFHTDETEYFANAFPGFDHTYAYNFKVDYIPYLIPPMGHVEAGLMTLSRYGIESAERIQLPCPFSWPVRVANLKRCLSVNRIPVEGTDH